MRRVRIAEPNDRISLFSHFQNLETAHIAMEIRQKIRVLAALRPFLRQMQAYKIESFRDLPLLLKIRKICLAIFIVMTILASPLLVFLSIWHIIENAMDISEWSTSFAVILSVAQLFFTGISIMVKYNVIVGLMDALQKIVDRRE